MTQVRFFKKDGKELVEILYRELRDGTPADNTFTGPANEQMRAAYPDEWRAYQAPAVVVPEVKVKEVKKLERKLPPPIKRNKRK